MRSSSCARRDRDERGAAELRRVDERDRPAGRVARRAQHVGDRAARRGQPGLERDAGGRDERAVEVEPADELGRPAAGERARVLVELARADDDVDRVGADLRGDHRRVRDQRELVRRVVGRAPWRARARSTTRRGRSSSRRARARAACVGDRRLGRRRLRRSGAPTPSGASARRAREPARRRAPARTSPWRASCSRSRCAVMFEMECARASSAIVTPPSAGSARGSALGASMRAHPSFLTKPHMCERSVLIDSSTSHE